VLRAALDLVDEHGVDALTMRRVATELGVDPMTLYRHLENKEALLDGIVELLWGQVTVSTDETSDWRTVLTQLGHGLREVVLAHPEAASLLLSRPVMPRSALELLQHALEAVQAAGFDDRRAAAIVRCVSSVALSDATLQVSYGQPGRGTGDRDDPGPDEWISIAQMLPPDTPPDLVRVAWAVCLPMEDSSDFSFAIDLITAGAEHLRTTP
jgi:TetR/AcrR family transcriptional regulator, tetracycline repressor protein